jgi:hypothetical protein
VNDGKSEVPAEEAARERVDGRARGSGRTTRRLAVTSIQAAKGLDDGVAQLDCPPRRVRAQRDLALAYGRFGRAAKRANLLSGAPRFGLDVDQAGSIIDEIAGVISKFWRAEVLKWGGSQEECEAIAPAFVYEGFDHPV